jgi:hypothetical protein
MLELELEKNNIFFKLEKEDRNNGEFVIWNLFIGLLATQIEIFSRNVNKLNSPSIEISQLGSLMNQKKEKSLSGKQPKYFSFNKASYRRKTSYR